MGRSPVEFQLSHVSIKVTLKNLGWKMIRLTVFDFGDVHGIAIFQLQGNLISHITGLTIAPRWLQWSWKPRCRLDEESLLTFFKDKHMVNIYHLPIPDTQCMVYLHIFTRCR